DGVRPGEGLDGVQAHLACGRDGDDGRAVRGYGRDPAGVGAVVQQVPYRLPEPVADALHGDRYGRAHRAGGRVDLEGRCDREAVARQQLAARLDEDVVHVAVVLGHHERERGLTGVVDGGGGQYRAGLLGRDAVEGAVADVPG